MQQKAIHCNLLYSLVLMSENTVIFMSYPVNQLFIFFLGTFIKYYKISQLIHTQIIAN